MGQLEERVHARLGTVLRGKYLLDSVLGMGGMAVVYKATHRNQAEYAIKMLHPELSLSDDLRARFLREGYAANSVKHPGVVRVVDDDVSEDGAAFLVMELLDGIACDGLAEKLGGRIPIDAVCAIAIELLDVLAAAHAKGIIHRDVKPANLFIARDGMVKVLDFGIARVRDSMTSAANATGTGMVLGTPVFMAPEQALGKASEIDARADIWSVGATIFSLASGTTVHDAETAPQLLVKLATQPARSLAVVVPAAPAAIVAIVDRALAFDRGNRWPTASAMRDAIAAAWLPAFGRVSPRALLASLVERPHEPAPRSAAGFETPAAIGSLPAATGPGAPAAVVETSSPVSSPLRGSRATADARRATRAVMGAVVGVAAVGSVVVLALVLRAKPPVASAPADAVTSETPAEPHPAISAAIATAESQRVRPDAEAPPAVATLGVQPAAPVRAHAAASPPPSPKIAPAPRPPSMSGVTQPLPVALPLTPPQTPPRPSTAASAPPAAAKPSLDPLDGRR